MNIRSLDREQGISTAPMSGIDPNIVRYAQQDQERAMSQVGNAITDFTQKIKEAQDFKTLDSESQSLLKYRLGVEDEIKKLPYNERESVYSSKMNEYKSGMASRLTDPKLLARMNATWSQDFEHGIVSVRHDAQKTMISETVAGLETGNDQFMTNIQRWTNDPNQYALELSKRQSAISAAFDRGLLSPEQKQDMMSKLGEKADYNLVRYQAEINPKAVLEKLNDPNQYTNLITSRPQLINTVQSEINKRVAEARQQQMLLKQQQAMEVQELSLSAQQALSELGRTGIKPKDFDNIMGDLSKYDNKTAKRIVAVMSDANNDAAASIEFKHKNINDMSAEITAQQQKYDAGLMNTDEQRQFTNKMGIYQMAMKSVSSGDHLQYAEKAKIIPVEPVNITDTASLKNRAMQVGMLQNTLGGRANYFTDTEAKSIADQWESGSIKDQRVIANAIYSLGSGQRDKILQITKQLHIKNPGIGAEIAMSATGESSTAELMSLGRTKLKNNPNFFGDTGKKLDEEIYKSIDTATGLTAFDVDGTRRQEIHQGIKNVYFGLADTTIDKVDTNLLKKATKEYLGGDLQSINGITTVPWWRDTANNVNHESMWRGVSNDLLLKSSGGKEPYEVFGTSKRKVDIEEIRNKTTPVPYGNGLYALAFNNINNKKISILGDEAGKPFLIDMEKIQDMLWVNKK
jgi:hypothetical protein